MAVLDGSTVHAVGCACGFCKAGWTRAVNYTAYCDGACRISNPGLCCAGFVINATGRNMSQYRGTIYRLGDDKHPVKASELGAGESIKVVNGNSTLYTVYRPPRHRDESPIQYYKRTGGVVDDRYYFRHNGLYYCNPAHCRKTWKDKEKRDEHLNMAFAALM